MTYQVLLARRVSEQLRDASAQRRGSLAGIVALLRVDPSVGTTAFPVVRGPNYHTVVFPDGRACSTTPCSNNGSWSSWST